jgi:hypothetical protein
MAPIGVKQQQVGGRSRRPARSNAGCSLPDAGFSLVALPATTSALLLPLAVAVKQQPGCPQSGRRCDPRFRETRSGVLVPSDARLSRKGQASFSRSRAEAGARLPMQVQAPGSGAGLLRLLTSGTVTSRCCNDGWKQESTARPRLAARCCPKHPRALGPMWSSLGVWSGCVCRNVHVLRAGTRGRAAAPRTHPFRVEGGNWR